MKVLITGGTGFIGRHLLQECMDNTDFTEIRTVSKSWHHKYKPVAHHTVDLSVQYEVEKMFTEYKPDIIYHLAANPIPKLDDKNPTKIIQDNVVATQNLLHFCPEGCKFILASSITVYGDMISSVSFNERDYPHPNSVYGLTKLTSEFLLPIYYEKRNIRGTALRLCATGGVDSSHGIIPDLINKCRFAKEPYLSVIGDRPGSSKPYMHIDDAIQAFKILTNKDTPKFVVNVGPIDCINCEEIANIVLEYFAKGKEIQWCGDQVWHGDNQFLRFDNLMLKGLGWTPKYLTSKSAVEQTVKEKHEQIAKEHSNGQLSSSR